MGWLAPAFKGLAAAECRSAAGTSAAQRRPTQLAGPAAICTALLASLVRSSLRAARTRAPPPCPTTGTPRILPQAPCAHLARPAPARPGARPGRGDADRGGRGQRRCTGCCGCRGWPATCWSALLASPLALGLLQPADLDGWKPIIDLAIAALVFELGSRLRPRWLIDNPWLAASCVLEGLCAALAVGAVLVWLGAPLLSAVLAAMVAASTSPVIAMAVGARAAAARPGRRAAADDVRDQQRAGDAGAEAVAAAGAGRPGHAGQRRAHLGRQRAVRGLRLLPARPVRAAGCSTAPRA